MLFKALNLITDKKIQNFKKNSKKRRSHGFPCNLKKNKKGLASCDTSASYGFSRAGAIYTNRKGCKSQPFFIIF